MANDKFREELIKQIQDCGKELMTNAEHLVPENTLISGFDIRVNLGINEEFAPTIDVTVKVLPMPFVERYGA